MNSNLFYLVAAGSRRQWGRLVGITAGIAVGVLLLLSLVAAGGALEKRDLRASVLLASGSPEIEISDSTVIADSPIDRFRDRPIDRLHIGATPDTTVEVPGAPAPPRPGTYYASPALAALVDSVPADQLGDRFGTLVGILPQDVLLGPDVLVAVVGFEPEALAVSPSAVTMERFEPTLFGGNSNYQTLAVIGAIALLTPVAVLVMIATQLGAAARREKFATMRFIGASPGVLVSIAVTEAALCAAVGSLAGIAAFFALRPALAATPIQGSSFFLADLTLEVPALALIALIVTATASAAAWIAVSRADIGPLGAARSVEARTPSAWRLVPIALGFAALVAVSTFADLIPFPIAVPLVAAFIVIMIGLLVAGPYLTLGVSGLLARHARSAVGVMAANRIRRSPVPTFRAVSGLVIAVFAVSVFAASASALESAEGNLDQPLLPPSGAAVPVMAMDADQSAAVDVVAALGRTAGVTDVVVSRVSEEGEYLDREDAGLLGAPVPDAQVLSIVGGIYSLVDSDDLLLPADVDSTDGLPIGTIVALTDGQPSSIERARTVLAAEGLVGASTRDEYLGRLDSDLARDFAALGYAGIAIATVVSGVSLAVSTIAAVLDRRRTIGLLRLVGMPRNALRRLIALEAAVPLLAVTALSIAAGYVAAALILGGLSERAVDWPEPAFFLAIGASLAFALAAVVASFRTADRATAVAVRFE